MKLCAALIAFFVLSQPGFSQDLKPDGKVAFLGLVFLNTSAEVSSEKVAAEEAARLQLLTDLIETRFREEGLDLLDISPIREELDGIANPANCYGCEVRMAAKLDADYVAVGVVQKVSNLILAMNLVMRDVETGTPVRQRVVDIRSNTDASWLRGMRYILKTAFFKE